MLFSGLLVYMVPEAIHDTKVKWWVYILHVVEKYKCGLQSSVLVILGTNYSISSIYLHLPPLQVFLPGQSLSLLQNWLLHLRTR